jgi:TPR repeat protein
VSVLQPSKTNDEHVVEELMKRVDGNDAGAMHLLAGYYHYCNGSVQQDHAKAIELYTRAAELGSSISHQNLGNIYHDGGNMKKAKFYYEAAAMAGQEVARYNLGMMEVQSGNIERALKHWTLAASGHYIAMCQLRTGVLKKVVLIENQSTQFW